MTLFHIHIELNQACMNDYTHLQDVMLSHGYVQEITNGLGESYSIPDSMFIIESDLSATKILENILQLVDKTNKKPFILVSESASSAWVLARKDFEEII
jgi:hypothetical protein